MKDAISLMGEERWRYTNVTVYKATLARWLDIVACVQAAAFGAMLEVVFLTSRMHTSTYLSTTRDVELLITTLRYSCLDALIGL